MNNLMSLKKSELVALVGTMEVNVEVSSDKVSQLEVQIVALKEQIAKLEAGNESDEHSTSFMRFSAFYPRKEAKATKKGGSHLGLGKVAFINNKEKQLEFDVAVFRNKDGSIGLAEKLVTCEKCRKAGVEAKIKFPGVKLYDPLLKKLAPRMGDFISKSQK